MLDHLNLRHVLVLECVEQVHEFDDYFGHWALFAFEIYHFFVLLQLRVWDLTSCDWEQETSLALDDKSVVQHALTLFIHFIKNLLRCLIFLDQNSYVANLTLEHVAEVDDCFEWILLVLAHRDCHNGQIIFLKMTGLHEVWYIAHHEELTSLSTKCELTYLDLKNL